MSQVRPAPYLQALHGRLRIEAMPGSSIALLGACKRHYQIQLRAGIDDPSDASENTIHFAKRSETIDVNRLQARGLREQFFVVHDDDSPQPHRANQQNNSCASRLSSVVHATDSVSITDKPIQFVGATPADDATVADAPAPAATVATILNINSISWRRS